MMSFRTRLTGFFMMIVVVPMAAIGFLVFRMIDDSQAGKADARASGVATAAAGVYADASREASLRARDVASQLALTPAAQLPARAGTLADQLGLARITVQVGSATAANTGDATAVAPGIAKVMASGGRPARTFTVSETTAAQFAHQLAGSGIEVVVRSGGRTLASTLAAAASASLPPQRGAVTVGGRRYQVATQPLAGFSGVPVEVSVLSSLAAAGGSVSDDRLLAAVFIAGFLLLAFFFALLAFRALHGQISQFLDAARRIAGGDFSASIPASGRDEFGQLGEEFNNMSIQLERRLGELEQERSRVRQAIRRIGEAFASGLDRDVLLQLALQTAMDATGAGRGRVSSRQTASDPLSETVHEGRLAGLEKEIYDAERTALSGGVGQASADDVHLATVALGPVGPGGPTHGLITVCREGRRFTEDDLELLRSLASQATLAMANVNMHYDIQRQAITDDLTGLATHGHFQDLLSAEMEEARRYQYPVGLIMIDIDDFKSVNDVYGHQQGDRVLRQVADALRESSREPDMAARYGGEEMALILPHTDLDGVYEMAERVRVAIESLEVPMIDGEGTLRVTTSVGAASSSDGDKNDLIAAADGALYVAKRTGKNRTVKAEPRTANVVGGE